MMKVVTPLLIICIINFSFSYAQTNTFPTNGNVGIGTTSPEEKFVVTGNQKLFGDLTFGSHQTAYFIRAWGNGGAIRIRSNITHAIERDIQFGNVDNNNSWTSFMTVAETGNVGIGTTNPDAKLSVNGVIRSKEVKVDINGWPDYVFAQNYNIRPLSEVKSYINQYQRLPELPSAEDVESFGLNLGEINRLLTKKIEELTLYLLAKEEEVILLKKNQVEQKREIQSIQRLLSRLDLKAIK